jgi:hypothetical protein
MKWTMNRIALLSIVPLAIVLSCSTAFAQNSVKASLDIQMYDVVYLTDFVNIKSQQLNPNISGVSLSLATDSICTKLWVSVYVELHIQLRGETDQMLMYAYTNNFDMLRYPMLAANNFANGGSSNIYIRNGMASYWEDTQFRKRLEDMAAKNPTAPPGKYTVIMKVLKATSEDPNDKILPKMSDQIGSGVTSIIVQFSTADEAFVEINDPKNGSFFNNLAPTFSWTSGTPVRVSVYEALPSHRSPQDALTGGNPSLVRQNFDATGHHADFSGNSLTYPGNAERQLEQNKAYVLLVEGRVTTNRGDVLRSSRPVVFRITDDNIGQMLDNFLNTFSGSASATYSTLRADPNNWVAWSPYGSITLDGSTLTQTDLQTLINDLASRPDLKIQLGVENQ